ncbi:unnamed protein product [Ceutorhynchus assimilis]|uniref:HTH psq-type domain-containing protein n=1 Tax=Ceutorhynchus assimilis TaxID=467358 RepID=A0A9N9QKT7_9CUCU|nr:unnamed protein product [Ceutorhynchus assimilis]
MSSVNEVRLATFMKAYKFSDTQEQLKLQSTSFDGSILPPCKVELQQQIQRAIYISSVWCNAHFQHPTLLSPTDCGWQEVDNKLEFLWFEGDQLPTSISDIIIDKVSETNDAGNNNIFCSEYNMPHFWIKKTKRVVPPPDVMQTAVEEVLAGAKLRPTARKYDIDKETLNRYVKKRSLVAPADNIAYSPDFKTALVFTHEEEALLSDYLVRASQMHHGLTVTCARQLAFQFARANHKRYSKKWDEKFIAGYDCPEILRPLPKAGPRKQITRPKRGSSRILTDTPEKDAIEAEASARKMKKVVPLKHGNLFLEKKKSVQKPATPPQSSSSDEEEQIQSGGSSEDVSDVESYEREMLQMKALEDLKTLQAGDFVLVKFCTKTSIVHYVGQQDQKLFETEEILTQKVIEG